MGGSLEPTGGTQKYPIALPNTAEVVMSCLMQVGFGPHCMPQSDWGSFQVYKYSKNSVCTYSMGGSLEPTGGTQKYPIALPNTAETRHFLGANFACSFSDEMQKMALCEASHFLRL
ncbi:hypothetical protein GDO78_020708 [Eleutherodactylus coqui]|uniref:Uncharacterized protein n=1 Tax=Eleutherodactylus coqui TaxID=57060 RepID=A0A8J6BFD2_ELECQ|nr:hypothetical protein GDO78_020708 [Eleutherodactylus coqui]